MRKLSLLLLVLILLLAGCSNVEGTSEAGNEEEGNEGNQGNQEIKGYEFVYNDINIAMYDEATSTLESLGKEMDYFEAESCAFQGMDKIYTYGGFELHTHEIEGNDYISSIIFLDDSVSTKEGIYLYSSLDNVLEAYGEDYSEEHGLYTYELEDSKLSFLIEDDEVTSIEYMAIAE